MSRSSDERYRPETLERELDHTRSEIGNTLAAIERRVSPAYLIGRILYRWRYPPAGYFKSLWNIAKSRPLVAPTVGISLAWMMASRGRLFSRSGGRPAEVHQASKAEAAAAVGRASSASEQPQGIEQAGKPIGRRASRGGRLGRQALPIMAAGLGLAVVALIGHVAAKAGKANGTFPRERPGI